MVEQYKRKFQEEYKRITVEQLVEFLQKGKIGEVSYIYESVNSKSFYIKCSGSGKFVKTNEGFNIVGEEDHSVKVEYNQIQDVIFLIGDTKKFDIKDIKGNNIIIEVK
jgi:hypothetical protein